MTGFTKLFSSITRSTIWAEDDATVKIWITMMALADRDGIVEASIPGLAHEARKSLEEVEAALKKFLSPDKYSRSKEYEGRRIEEVRGGWRLLNHDYYRGLLDQDDQRERAAERQRRSRERKASGQQSLPVTDERDTSRSVTGDRDTSQESRNVRQAEAESDPKAEADPDQEEREAARAAARLKEQPKRSGAYNADQVAAADRVWAVQNSLRREVIKGARDLKPTKPSLDAICKLFTLSHTEDDCLDVLRSVAARVKRDPAQGEYFNGTTTWRPENFQRELGKIGVHGNGANGTGERKTGFDHVLDSIAEGRRARGEV
jgi:hypothetical protein